MQRRCWVMLSLLLVCCVAAAQRRSRDPLTDKEVYQMRETADYPNKRIELMIGFARARINSIEQLQADAKAAEGRPQKIHGLLEDFLTLVDEIDDNIDMYTSHKADMRKGLKLLIEADSEFQLRLRRLKEQSPPAEMEQYSFVLTNATEAVNDSAQTAREMLQEQNELAKDKKLNKDWSERKD